MNMHITLATKKLGGNMRKEIFKILVADGDFLRVVLGSFEQCCRCMEFSKYGNLGPLRIVSPCTDEIDFMNAATFIRVLVRY